MRRAAGLCAVCAAIAAGVASAAPGPPGGAVQARVLVSPLSVTVLVPASATAGRAFRIRARVDNAGAATLRNVAVRLVAPGELELGGPATQLLAQLRPGESRRVDWRVCTTHAGGYVVLVRATRGAFTAESAAALVNVAAARRPRC